MSDEPKSKPTHFKTFEEMSEAERLRYGPRPPGRKRKFNPTWDTPGDADINNEVDDD